MFSLTSVMGFGSFSERFDAIMLIWPAAQQSAPAKAYEPKVKRKPKSVKRTTKRTRRPEHQAVDMLWRGFRSSDTDENDFSWEDVWRLLPNNGHGINQALRIVVQVAL